MKTRPTIEPGYRYYRLGIRWLRIRMGLAEEWAAASDLWRFAGKFEDPGTSWRPFGEADLLKEELAACSAMVHTLEAQLVESREFLRISRAKNSALRHERWVAAGSNRREAPKPVADEPLRRWYHRDDGFTDGTKFFEIRDGQVYTDQGKARVDHTAKSWEYASKSFVPEGIWIEVRGTNVPANLPKPPPVPKGFTHWEYHAKWKKGSAIQYAYFDGGLWVTTRGYPAGLYTHYLEAKEPEVAVRAGTVADKLVVLKSFLTEDMLDEAVRNTWATQQALSATPNPNYVSAPREDVTFKLLPAPKTRIFRHKTGFKDRTDHIEIEGRDVYLAYKDGSPRMRTIAYTVESVEYAVRRGVWYEVFDSPSPLRANVQRYAEVVSRDFNLNRDITVRAALTQKFGEVPPMAVLIKHLHRVIDHNKVEHWLWLDKPLQIGEKAPLNKAICRINPPSFGPYGNPES